MKIQWTCKCNYNNTTEMNTSYDTVKDNMGFELSCDHCGNKNIVALEVKTINIIK